MGRACQFALALLLLTATLGFAGIDGTQSIIVDCDAGDNLAKALAEADRGGPSRISVRGTCRGSFRIETAGVDLRGVEPGAAVIEGPEFDPAIQVTATKRVVIRDLEIRDGAVGLRVLGPRSDVVVFSSRISARYIGVWVSGSSQNRLDDVELFGSEVGVIVDDHSTGRLVDSSSNDNSIAGGTVGTHSSLSVTGSEITGNGEFGLRADRVATLSIDHSTLADNGEVHAFASDRSRLHLWSETTLGGEDDPTEFALGVHDVSRLQINDEVRIYGDVHGSQSSFLSIATSEIHGSALLFEFSNFRIVSSEIDGTVICQSGADAVCSWGAIATTDGCPSAEPGCGASSFGPAGPAVPRMDTLLERLERNAPRELGRRLEAPAELPDLPSTSAKD